MFMSIMHLKRDLSHEDDFILAPRVLATGRYFCPVKSSGLKGSGRAVGLWYFDSFGLIFFLLASLTPCSTLSGNPLAVLSYKPGNWLWNFLTAAVALC